MIDDLLVVSIASNVASQGLHNNGRCEKWHVDQTSLDAMLLALNHLAPERVVLCTCERFEIYAIAQKPFEQSAWRQFLAKHFSLPCQSIENAVCFSTGQPAVSHLLRIAAGLESRIVGEPHVLGQVRNAFLRAKSLETTGPILNALGRAAIHCGKRVRSETNINRRGTSVVSLTLDRLRLDLGTIHNKPIAIVGTGKLAGELATELTKNGAKLSIVSQCLARAKTLARQHDATAIDLIDFPKVLAASGHGLVLPIHAIIACTSANSYVLDSERLSSCKHRSMHVYDLGVPRNVDPAVTGLEAVSLVQLDDLCRSSDQIHVGVEHACQIVQACVGRLLDWYRERLAAPRIVEAIEQARNSVRSGEQLDSWRLHRRIMQLKQETAA